VLLCWALRVSSKKAPLSDERRSSKNVVEINSFPARSSLGFARDVFVH